MDIMKTISEMTLEEKASLLSGHNFWHTKAIERHNINTVMLCDGPHGLRKQVESNDHLGISNSIKSVCLPPACAAAASFDRDVLKDIGEAIGDACQHEKVAVSLGPAINIKRSPLCGRNFEYFSEDPYLTGELATSFIKAVQSRNIGVSVKHFAANNQEHRRMSSNSVVDERTLREIYFPAFEKAIKEGKAWTVMCSYNRLNGEHASQNRWLLTDVLRNEWGFDGYVVSDWGAVSDRVKGVHAGLDLEMPASGGSNDKRVVEAVHKGKIDEKDVDLAVRRILTIHQRYLDNAKPETEWDMEAQHKIARKLAAECMVLLKNEGSILPLHEGESIAIIGQFAKEPRFQGGGSSHINSFKVESLMDALEGVDGITYVQGYDTMNEELNEILIEEAVKVAKATEKAVIVAGLPDNFESEGYDRTHIRMPQSHEELINRVAEVNSNTIVVLYNGSPVEMQWLGNTKAVIEAYLGGQAVGGATCDVLFGNVNPCGRLPESFPIKLEDTPSYISYGGEGDIAIYNEGIFVGYRYYDKKKMNVLFTFGYGLSYTTFNYDNLQVSAESIKDIDTLTVTVDVTNTGKTAGKEVVQLYVSDCDSTVFRPLRELKGFEKIFLTPGETKTVNFTLDKRSFAYWNVNLKDWHVETGVFNIEIGRNSRDIVLRKSVFVASTVILPVHITVDTLYADIIDNSKAVEALSPALDAMMRNLSGGGSSVASSAISYKLAQAIIRYMPLRALISFGGGKITYEQLQDIVDEINKNETLT